ncbi:hypothetical protein [Christiangramia crocea]|uniref:Uncharacterized protein n=1 Tax=Christiangramia crocea TaxID=2904124 RepID=A0A9X2A7P2_9FLAO|nr:hypothetical protein [Gramella crocea]MCG9971013.1 hypothetical protein [Gramella crocea]
MEVRKQEIREEMESLAHKIGFLEDSKFMNNRYKVSQMNKRWKELQNQLLNL